MRSTLLMLPLRFATWLMGLWVRPDVLPENPKALVDNDNPVLYVLETGGLADRAALNLVCRQYGLAKPLGRCNVGTTSEAQSVAVLARHTRGLFQRSSSQVPARLGRLVEAAVKDGSSSLQIVPVAIYWGRSPAREASLLKQMFSENWQVAGRTRKFFKTIFHGRYTLVHFSEPLSLVPIHEGNHKPEVAVRKVSRILRVHFRNRRIATLGPDLSHRRTLIDRVLINPAVLDEINRTAAHADGSRRGGNEASARFRARLEAERYAREIAADISYPTVRVLRKLLAKLWNTLYDGVRLDGLERVTAVAEGRELVYVPCHRSHIDYLLLSYILHLHGMSLPHIAAGINLNLPLVGPLLRRGGAFFLRRSFRDNKLYAQVFNAYLQEILQRGHSLEYFVEGGRSRTGRLLAPKGGMLAMTAHSYLKQPQRPLLFVPVYFGYERLVEGGAFASELSGGKKSKETLGGLFRSLGLLRQTFGSVYVNFATPIAFDEILDRQNPGWRSQPVPDERPTWLAPAVNELGDEIMQRINAAASVTPIGLLSFALLTTPHGRIALGDLQALLKLLQQLLRDFPYSPEVVTPDSLSDAGIADTVQHGIDLKYIERKAYELGDTVEIRQGQTIPLSFFRNNVLHLFALPGCVACCFVNQSEMSLAEIQRLVSLVFPYLKDELYIHWPEEKLGSLTAEVTRQFVSLGLLQESEDGLSCSRAPTGSRKSFLLRSLGQSVMPSLQRYYLTASVLSRLGSGVITAQELGRVCGQCAERLEQIHGLRSPDFYNKELFKGFIATLGQQAYVQEDENGMLLIREEFATVESDARAILGEQTRHSILNITSRREVLESAHLPS